MHRIFIFYFFLLFASFSDLRKSDSRFSLRRKVDPRSEGYVWVPKSWSFVKLHEVENFPTCVISSLLSIYWLEIFLEAMRSHKFKSSIFLLSVGIFRNF